MNSFKDKNWHTLIQSKITERSSNTEYWSEQKNVETPWPHRAQIASKHIRKGLSVLDIGCGSKYIRKLLPNNEYYGADIVNRDGQTLIAEINKKIFPDGFWDVALALGVLEYIYDFDYFIDCVRRHSKRLIFTYHFTPVDHPASKDFRIREGWLSNFRIEELLEKTKKHYKISLIKKINNYNISEQYIFILDLNKKHIKPAPPLNKKLSFPEYLNHSDFLNFEFTGKRGLWSTSKLSKIYIPSLPSMNYTIELEFYPFNPTALKKPQEIEVSIGDSKFKYIWEVGDDKPINIAINTTCQSEVAEIVVETRAIRSPYSTGSSKIKNKIGVCLSSLLIKETQTN